MPKKIKAKPPVLHTREGMEAAAAEYLKAKLSYATLTAELETAKAKVEANYIDRLNALADQVDQICASVQNFCTKHRSELMPDQKKSFETMSATIGFRDTPPRTEKAKKKDTWEQLADSLVTLKIMDAEGDVILAGINYVKEPALQVNKEALLADRGKFTADQLKQMGIRFEQDEVFYIDPKSDVVTGDVKAA